MPTRKSPDLLIVIVLTLCAVLLALANVEQPVLRALATAPLVFLYPGYAVVAALFARKPMTAAARLLFALALSMAITGAVGLALHVAGLGLTPRNWTIWLSAITLVGSIAGLLRRPTNVVADRLIVNLKPAQILIFAAAAGLALVALRVAQDGVRQQPRPGFTQLWMLPVANTASGVELGIRNEEGLPLAYHLVVELDGEVVGEWEAIPLAEGEVWETTALIPERSEPGETVRALLYRLDAPDEVYRTTSMTPAQ